MKIRKNFNRSPVAREYESLQQYAENSLDGDDYDKGILEATASTAENNSKAIGRLLDLLARDGLISATDAEYIVEGDITKTAVFIK